MAQRLSNTREKEAPVARFSYRPHRIPMAILWVLAVLAYANSFRAGLVFDNQFVIGMDQRLRAPTAANVKLILTEDYWYQTSTSGLYRPLTTLSFLFNYAVLGNGKSPAGYHAINLLLHCTNITLVYVLGWLLFAEFWPAFAMAALWSVHPALTESITNIVGRSDLLATFGVLAGVICFARSLTAGNRLKWRLLLLLAVAVGMFSKENGIVAIAAIFLYDVAYCREFPLRERLMGYLAAAVPIVVYLMVRQSLFTMIPVTVAVFTDNPLAGADFFTSRLTAIKVLGNYLWKLLWPAWLSCDYSYNQVPLLSWKFNNWEDWKTVLALLGCVGAAWAAFWAYRYSKPVFFFIGLFFVSLAPTANIFLLIGTIMAERFLYLPAVAFTGVLAWAGWRAGKHNPKVFQAAVALLCLAYCARTFARNLDWKSDQTLWESAVRAAPESYKAHHDLAHTLAVLKPPQLEEAQREAERALAILKPLPDELNVSAAYATAGSIYRSKAVALGEGRDGPWMRKSLDTMLEGQRLDIAWFNESYRKNAAAGKTLGVTGWMPLYLELGRTYRAMGDFPHALEALAHARLIQQQTMVFEEISFTYRDMKDPDRAVIALMQGLTMQAPDQVQLAAEVVDLYRTVAPQSCALSGNVLNFNCPLVRQHLCVAAQDTARLYRQMFRPNDAVSTARSAVSDLGCPAEMFR